MLNEAREIIRIANDLYESRELLAGKFEIMEKVRDENFSDFIKKVLDR